MESSQPSTQGRVRANIYIWLNTKPKSTLANWLSPNVIFVKYIYLSGGKAFIPCKLSGLGGHFFTLKHILNSLPIPCAASCPPAGTSALTAWGPGWWRRGSRAAPPPSRRTSSWSSAPPTCSCSSWPNWKLHEKTLNICCKNAKHVKLR